MKLRQPETFAIDNFEGPINLLWHLIQRDEIDIFGIALRQLTSQQISMMHKTYPDIVDDGAEFISCTAALIWFKSRALLPQQVQEDQSYEDEADPGFEVIHHLIDYCCFREAAKELAEREQKQSAFYVRGVEEAPAAKHLGIDHLSLDELAEMFRLVLAKTAPSRGVIYEEVWKVSDKIHLVRELLTNMDSIPFGELFTPEKSREELIVTFLALLELMKTGEVRVNASLMIVKGIAHG